MTARARAVMRFPVVPGFVAGLLGAGCGGGPTTVTQLPATVTLRLTGEVRIASPELTLRLVEIVQDSRCPVNVTCVQAGSVRLRFTVIGPDGSISGLVMDSDRPDTSLGILLRITEVNPVRRAGSIIDARDYRITLEIAPIPPS